MLRKSSSEINGYSYSWRAEFMDELLDKISRSNPHHAGCHEFYLYHGVSVVLNSVQIRNLSHPFVKNFFEKNRFATLKLILNLEKEVDEEYFSKILSDPNPITFLQSISAAQQSNNKGERCRKSSGDSGI